LLGRNCADRLRKEHLVEACIRGVIARVEERPRDYSEGTGEVSLANRAETKEGVEAANTVFPVIGKHPLEPGAEVGAVFRSKPIHVKDVREDAADLPEDTEERKDESQWEVPIDAM
jgi:hypothetical protein